MTAMLTFLVHLQVTIIHAIGPSAYLSLFPFKFFCASYFHACVPSFLNADCHVLTVILYVSVSTSGKTFYENLQKLLQIVP
jgi:hypothetical protein